MTRVDICSSLYVSSREAAPMLKPSEFNAQKLAHACQPLSRLIEDFEEQKLFKIKGTIEEAALCAYMDQTVQAELT